jgi:hypothetical protein
MPHDLKEELIPIQINCPAADFPAKNRQPQLATRVDVDLACQFLVPTDADIGAAGPAEDDGVGVAGA